MNQIVLEPVRLPAAGRTNFLRYALVDPLIGGLTALETWRRRHKASMQSTRLEPRILYDLGISEAQRFIEVNKPFWEK